LKKIIGRRTEKDWDLEGYDDNYDSSSFSQMSSGIRDIDERDSILKSCEFLEEMCENGYSVCNDRRFSDLTGGQE
jgi:hypothetical protein